MSPPRKIKQQHGGARPGAGRPKTHEALSFAVPLWVAAWLRAEAARHGLSTYAFAGRLVEAEAVRQGAAPGTPVNYF
jgi:hypothetical protein